MNENWTCMVCRELRPDARISVYSETQGPLTINIRYCNDNPKCVEGAKKHSLLKLLRKGD
ncbi:hypothetical protein ES703_91030 [subsurface metagenome]